MVGIAYWQAGDRELMGTLGGVQVQEMGAMGQPIKQNRTTGAYTLIEMMIVMVILIVVMALVAPVIGNARNAAKKTNTMQLLMNVGQSSQQFELSERRMPGYFNITDMAHQENQARGFTEMANILLDLAGGRSDAASGDTIEVGPRPTATTFVRVGLIGAPTQTKGVMNRGYFTPDPKYFVLHQSTDQKVTNVPDQRQLPDLIDGFGQPILAWRQDLEPNEHLPSFAAIDIDAARASYYWTPNAAFIKATKLGKRAQDQTATSAADGEGGSMLFWGPDFQPPDVLKTMEGLLGNPAFPIVGRPDRPAAGRGKLVFHSAGIDGIYLSRKDRGGVINTTGAQNSVKYEGGRDPLDNFDDITSVAGN